MNASSDEPVRDERRIVVGVDGSTSSSDALKWAARQAEMTGCTLEVLTTWAPPSSFMWSVYPDDLDLAAEATSALNQMVEPVSREYPDITVRPRAVEGHPAHVLIDASRGADLLVVGSRGHGAFSGMTLGSVSQHCVAQAHCPVLVLRDSQ